MAEKRDWPFLTLLILGKDKISVPDIFLPYVKKIFDLLNNFRQKLSFLSMEKILLCKYSYQITSDQLLSRVRLFATP